MKLMLFTLALCQMIAAADLRVAVVQFEEKNAIGLENAGTIVAEWVATEMGKLGHFKMEERLLLANVLEEQALMQAGVIDESQAVKIGKLYGVNAVVTGSVMKIGQKISVTGRIVNVGTGSVLKTASVSTILLEELEKEAYVLANNLCDISRDQFEIARDIEKQSRQRYEFGGGLGFSWNKSGGYYEDNYGSGMNIEVMGRYNSRYLTAWIDGSPAGGLKHIDLGLAVFPKHNFGIAAAWGTVYDDLINYVEVAYLNFGIVLRPRHNVEMGLLFGGALGGVVWTMDEDEIAYQGYSFEPEQEMPGHWSFPDNLSIWTMYDLTGKLALMARINMASLGNVKEELPAGYYYPGSDDYVGSKLHVSLLYCLNI